MGRSAVKFWVVVPAAGSSRRMGASVTMPKQYLPLAGRTVLEWSLAPFLQHEDCAGVVVVVAQNDRHWQALRVAQHPKVSKTIGGAERVDSVRAGLAALATHIGKHPDDHSSDRASERARERDWVLVHDAARPCLQREDLRCLVNELRDDEVGGLLAVPVVDTLKLADSANRVSQTVSRASLWRALTPQMFRYGVLQRALASSQRAITDEAQAVEELGLHPRLVAGDPDNIKITVVDDLQRAERILQSRGAT